jgi:beta-lactamase regulating signal transducer with metallopeptidase domain
MTLLLLAAIKMSVVLVLALGLAASLRRRSAALRHWVLALGILLAALTPLAGSVLPSWHLPVLQPAASAPTSTAAGQVMRLSSASADLTAATTAAVGTVSSTMPLLPTLAVLLWAIGVAIGVASVAAGGLRLRALARRARPVHRDAWLRLARDVSIDYRIADRVTLLQSAHPHLLVTWGLRRPRVLLPAAARFWSDERIEVVLRHELAHIKRGDWAIQIGAVLVRALCWFNPLAWIAFRQLRQESERACDDMVLRHGVDGADYAAHLVAIARAICHSRRAFVPAPAIAHSSTLEKRIRAMLNPRCDRTLPTHASRALTTASLLATTIIVGAAALSAATPTTPAVTPPTTAVPAAAPLDRSEANMTTVLDVTMSPSPAAAPVEAAAQAGRGSLSGTVMDQLGGLLPGVEMTLTSDATGGALVTVTDRRGGFEFRDVRPGLYALQAASLAGFKNVRVPVSVAPDAAHTRSLVMPVGTLQETITVTGTRGAAAEVTAPRPPKAAVDRSGRDPRVTLAELMAETSRTSSFRAGTVGGQIKAPAKTRHVNPIYPASAQSTGVEGVVSLVARIGVDGQVLEAFQTRESDANPPVHPDLVAAAIDAVHAWEFTPTHLNGVPVEVQMTVSVQFSLR